jgi:hypothetical protein
LPHRPNQIQKWAICRIVDGFIFEVDGFIFEDVGRR